MSGEIVVANTGDDSVLFFARNAAGDVAPVGVLQGPDTKLKGPVGVSIDGKLHRPERPVDKRIQKPSTQTNMWESVYPLLPIHALRGSWSALQREIIEGNLKREPLDRLRLIGIV